MVERLSKSDQETKASFKNFFAFTEISTAFSLHFDCRDPCKTKTRIINQ